MTLTEKLFNSIKRFLLLITVIAFTVIGITACNPTKLKTNAAQVPQLVRSILNDPKTFNAALGSESPNIFDLTYEGLLTQNPINGKIEGALAQSWEISPDKTKITFTMREGLKWSANFGFAILDFGLTPPSSVELENFRLAILD
jgi:peptide/nickel transport system substrate-binding protein